MISSLGKTFSANVKRERLARKWSQALLAEHCRASLSFISMLEVRKREPSLGFVEIVAKALAVPPYTLLQTPAERRGDAPEATADARGDGPADP